VLFGESGDDVPADAGLFGDLAKASSVVDVLASARLAGGDQVSGSSIPSSVSRVVACSWSAWRRGWVSAVVKSK
jgi:hypothetical protein